MSVKKHTLNPHELIEVIAKCGEKVYKIINITRAEFSKMKRKPNFDYQAFQLGFSAYKNAVIIDFNKI